MYVFHKVMPSTPLTMPFLSVPCFHVDPVSEATMVHGGECLCPNALQGGG